LAPLAAAVLVSAVALAGCTSPRDTLGTADSRCYKALPAASQAVHEHGRFAGVRYVSTSDLLRALRRHHAVGELATGLAGGRAGGTLPAHTAACVVAYVGNFSAVAVERDLPTRASSGRLALVVVRADDTRVLATIVLRRPPLRFIHAAVLIGH
jgi:hypothetical protein